MDSQAWTTDPWILAERDGRLYGRGTCDMKGFVAIALTAAAAAARRTASSRRRSIDGSSCPILTLMPVKPSS
ncbi:MAG: M20/M25/M40 family metallo-hydrolase [Acetobacteraceae bacterium]